MNARGMDARKMHMVDNRYNVVLVALISFINIAQSESPIVLFC